MNEEGNNMTETAHAEQSQDPIVLCSYQDGKLVLWEYSDFGAAVETGLAMENDGPWWVLGAEQEAVDAYIALLDARDEVDRSDQSEDERPWLLEFEVDAPDGTLHRGAVSVDDPDEWAAVMTAVGVRIIDRRLNQPSTATGRRLTTDERVAQCRQDDELEEIAGCAEAWKLAAETGRALTEVKDGDGRAVAWFLRRDRVGRVMPGYQAGRKLRQEHLTVHQRLVIGCPGCIEIAKHDQDVAAIKDGGYPDRQFAAVDLPACVHALLDKRFTEPEGERGIIPGESDWGQYRYLAEWARGKVLPWLLDWGHDEDDVLEAAMGYARRWAAEIRWIATQGGRR